MKEKKTMINGDGRCRTPDFMETARDLVGDEEQDSSFRVLVREVMGVYDVGCPGRDE